MVVEKPLYQRCEFMKCIHVFVEEASIKRVLDVLMPKILPEGVTFRTYPHQGKQDLEKAIRSTMPSISKIPGSRIIISRDQDSGECTVVKSNIEKQVQGKVGCPYKIRIVCQELESWFLGDLQALSKAFPRFNPDAIAGKAAMRFVDGIANPSQYLLKVIPEYASTEHLPKIENAERIAPFMDINENKSISFLQMVNAIKYLAER